MKNRRMNKKLIAILSITGAISYFGTNLEVTKTPSVLTLEKIMQEKKSPVISNTIPVREPGSEAILKLPVVSQNNVEPDYAGIKHAALPEGYEISEHIFAIKSSEYNLVYGPKVQERNGYTFFSGKERPQNSNIVVIDQRSKKLYLISSVIKLENVSEDLRHDLISKGVEEHYYSNDLGIMYVKSNQDDILNTHEELKTLNVAPQLELIRSFHKPI
jgi:hypothetical protein